MDVSASVVGIAATAVFALEKPQTKEFVQSWSSPGSEAGEACHSTTGAIKGLPFPDCLLGNISALIFKGESRHGEIGLGMR